MENKTKKSQDELKFLTSDQFSISGSNAFSLPSILFTKYTLMSLDETLYYVPEIEKVLEKVEAFKRK